MVVSKWQVSKCYIQITGGVPAAAAAAAAAAYTVINGRGTSPPSKPSQEIHVATVKVRVLASLPSVVVMLPMLPVQHAVVKPGVQVDGNLPQQVVQPAVPEKPAGRKITVITALLSQPL